MTSMDLTTESPTVCWYRMIPELAMTMVSYYPILERRPLDIVLFRSSMFNVNVNVNFNAHSYVRTNTAVVGTDSWRVPESVRSTQSFLQVSHPRHWQAVFMLPSLSI